MKPTDPIRSVDKVVYGENVQRHPVLGFLIETGIGAASVERQAEMHCDMIEQQHGKAAADLMRKKLHDAANFAANAQALAADGLTPEAALSAMVH